MKRILYLISCWLFFVFHLSAQSDSLSSTAMREDLNYLVDQLIQVHPDPFYRMPQTVFGNIKDSIMAELDGMAPVDSFYFKAAELVAALKDGHTSLLRPTFASSDRLKKKSVIFPLKIKIREGCLYAVYDYAAASPLDTFQLISINGVHANEILKRMLSVCSYDKYENVHYSMIEGKFIVLFNELYGATPVYQIEMKINGENKMYDKAGISYAELARVMKKQMLANYELNLNEREKTARIRLGDFYPAPKLLQFMDSVFEILKKEKVQELTIDVRGNTGGSSVMVDSLLAYLTAKPYRLYNQVILKISEPIKEKYRKRDSLLYAQICNLPTGYEFIIRPPLIEPIPKSNLFTGKIKVLSDRRTYSGASSFVHLVKNMQIGNVIGETGGCTTYFGDFLLFELPFSKLKVAIATKKFTEYTTEEPENPKSRDN